MDNPSGERPKRKVVLALEDFLRHPMATMLIGFVLTGVVGTMLTNHFANLRQKEAAAIYGKRKLPRSSDARSGARPSWKPRVSSPNGSDAPRCWRWPSSAEPHGT
jgi:hypothetical protein